MRARCRRPGHPQYHRYGGRGISVCEEWREYATFRSWATQSGYRRGLTIERVNNDGNYEPGNCVWATPLQQSRNKSTSRRVAAFGEMKVLAEWAVDPRSAITTAAGLAARLDNGWSPEDAITTPAVPTGTRGERVSTAKLTADRVRTIRLLSADGVTNTALAREYGVSQPTISSIVQRKTWRHVADSKES